MSVTVLLSGKVFRSPERKTSGKGNAYAIATVRDGQGDDAQWWRVMAFSDATRDELLALRDGDGVAVSGTMRAEIYAKGDEPRLSLTVLADRLITARRQKRERRGEAGGGRDPRANDAADAYPFNDEVIF